MRYVAVFCNTKRLLTTLSQVRVLPAEPHYENGPRENLSARSCFTHHLTRYAYSSTHLATDLSIALRRARVICLGIPI